jgi:hypothetical protein
MHWTKLQKHSTSSPSSSTTSQFANAMSTTSCKKRTIIQFMMGHSFRGTLRNHLRHHLTALREENARVLRATLVGNRVIVACKTGYQSQQSIPKRKKNEPKAVEKQNKNKRSATREPSRKDFHYAHQSRTAARRATPKKLWSRQCRATEDKTRAGICNVTPHPSGVPLSSGKDGVTVPEGGAREDPGMGWCNDTQLVRCFGAMLRLFRRLVAHTASDLASSSSFEFDR